MSETLTYSELKKWFLDQAEKKALPETLNGEYRYWINPSKTAETCIYQIDSEFERLGGINIKKSATAKASKRTLNDLYIALENKDNWNKPMKKSKN